MALSAGGCWPGWGHVGSLGGRLLARGLRVYICGWVECGMGV